MEHGPGIFTMDFQNDGEFVGGCIAGGRNYFHINANGDAEPCVFIHYSNGNIHENTILEILKQPLFMAYLKNAGLKKDEIGKIDVQDEFAYAAVAGAKTSDCIEADKWRKN